MTAMRAGTQTFRRSLAAPSVALRSHEYRAPWNIHGLDIDNQILVKFYYILIRSQFEFSKAPWNSLFHLMYTQRI
jgi:hypothetical protein